MKRFSALIDRLLLTPSRNAKLTLMQDYFRTAPDPDRGFALAALTGGLSFSAVKPGIFRALAAERVDPVLFAYSYDYVGDLAETVSLIWPAPGAAGEIGLAQAVEALSAASRSDAARVVAALLDRLDPPSRYALIKLATGALRIGVSARLARQALARMGDVEAHEIEEIWHGLEPPYEALFAWLEGRSPKPERVGLAPFRPVMLSHPVDAQELARLDPRDFRAEWKWDGIRVQAVRENGTARLYSRTGDDISPSFPDLVAAMDFEGALDGELLVGEPPQRTGSFSDLQQRLNRKSVAARTIAAYPVFMRCYDLLQDGGEDLRPLPFLKRRGRLEEFVDRLDPARFDLSPMVAFEDWGRLEALRAAPVDAVVEGVMLKRADSPYLAGRPKGYWFKWKQDPLTVDAVLMYAQRGHGARSGFYSDYTFGVWSGPEQAQELVPVGKAYFGFTDEELRRIDGFVRDNTVDRYGPVRAVRADLRHGLVMEIAFEGLARSTRHKSGIAMRFPRVSRLRWDKPAAEADRLETLLALLDSGGA